MNVIPADYGFRAARAGKPASPEADAEFQQAIAHMHPRTRIACTALWRLGYADGVAFKADEPDADDWQLALDTDAQRRAAR